MTICASGNLDDYLASAEDTTRELIEENGLAIQILRDWCDFFTSDLLPRCCISTMPTILAVNSYLLLLSGIRSALSGHPAAVYPVLRTALESVCYAFVITGNPALEAVWLNRHTDRSNCRKKFSSAVSETVKALNAIQADSGVSIQEVYDAAIDFGGHPNVKGILSHTDLNVRTNVLSLVGLYDKDALEVSRSLLACLDFSMAISVVFLRLQSDAPLNLTLERLIDLNRRKEEAATLGGMHP